MVYSGIPPPYRHPLAAADRDGLLDLHADQRGGCRFEEGLESRVLGAEGLDSLAPRVGAGPPLVPVPSSDYIGAGNER